MYIKYQKNHFEVLIFAKKYQYVLLYVSNNLV